MFQGVLKLGQPQFILQKWGNFATFLILCSKKIGKNMNFQSPMKCCQMFQGVLKFGQPSFILQKCQCQGHTEFNTSCNCRSNVQLCYLLDWYLSEFSVWFRFLTARDRGNVGKCTHGKIYKNVLISYSLTFLTMMTII